MRKVILGFLLALGMLSPALAQQGCGGVNFTPTPGVNCLQEPLTASYAATGIGIVPAASATDVACITGVAGKVIRVQRIRVSGTAGTAVVLPVTVTKHAAANSGGTAATTTALPVPYALDSTNAAAGAATTAYTANPTINDAAPGVISSANLALTTTAAPTGNQTETIFDWSTRLYYQAPILRGVAQQVCVNLNAVSVTTGSLNISFVWTEAGQ